MNTQDAYIVASNQLIAIFKGRLVIGIMLVAWSLNSSLATADDRGLQDDAATTPQRDVPTAQLDTILDELWTLTDMVETVGQRVGDDEVVMAGHAIRESVGLLDDHELGELTARLPEFQMLKRQFQVILDALPAAPTVDVNEAPPAAATPSAFPGGGYSSQCQPPRLSTAGALATVVARQVVESVAVLASRACALTIAGNSSETACIVTDGLFLAAKVAEEHILFCVADIDSAEILGSYQRLGHIHSDLTDARLGTYAENDTDSSILANDGLINDARDLIVKALAGGTESILSAIEAMVAKVQAAINMHFAEQNEELRAWRIYRLKLWIEEDLGREMDEHRIGSFQLPASIVCPSPIDDVPCGSLETVEQCVKDTIANMETAGEPTYDAQLFLEKGRHAFSLGEYKEAYAHYSRAYRLASALEQPPLGACCHHTGLCEDGVLSFQCMADEDTWHEATVCKELEPLCECINADPPCDDNQPALAPSLGRGIDVTGGPARGR